MAGRVVVISGPSGSGKTSLCAELAKDPRFVRSISATTRAPRGVEQHGREYWFLTDDEFRRWIAEDRLLEWAEVYGRFYGTPREPVERILAEGRWPVLNIDTQGARRLREKCIDAVHVFLVPPSMEVLRERLRRRGEDSEAAVAKRLALAEREMAEAPRYDFQVVNDELARAADEVRRKVFLRAGVVA